MTSPDSAEAFPTPREGLDNGSLTELRIDAGEVVLDVPPRHPAASAHHDITSADVTSADIMVPDDASSLLEGMEAYGA